MSAWDKIKTLLIEHPELTFWWRDDDLGKPTSQGERMLTLAATYNIPLTLAVIPESAEDKLVPWLENSGVAYNIAQHGVTHRNNACHGAKKCELVKDFDVSLLLEGKKKLKHLFPNQFKSIFVPPWNRFDPCLTDFLIQHYDTISTFGDEENAHFLNTHLDVINWKEDKKCISVDGIYTVLESHNHDVPCGILTHHLVHEESHWKTLKKLFQLIGRERFITL